MKYLFELSKENLKLARAEAETLMRSKGELIGNLLICESDASALDKRLAYTHLIYQFLFKSDAKSVESAMQSFDWKSIYKKDFCIRVFGSGKEASSVERSLAGFVWEKLKSPKVNLDNPTTAFHLFYTGKMVICGRLIAEVDKSFEDRKAHLRPEFAPISLHPKLARAVVNLTGADIGDTICDPFCGTGGILIEAGLMGIKPVGFDIDKRMIESSRQNLEYYKIKGYSLKQMDAIMLKDKFDFIVTDLPYGKNTGRLDTAKLYAHFLRVLKSILKKRAVIIFPKDVDALIKKSGLVIKDKFHYYIHKSMTKSIYVLAKSSEKKKFKKKK